MELQNILTAFGLTIIAGLSTGIGGLVTFFTGRDNAKFLTISLGFSAGVMIFVSFVDIFPHSMELFSNIYGAHNLLATCIALFSGMALIAIIDLFIPEDINPHEMSEHHKFKRMGLLVAISLIIHNFPEGLATFSVALNDPDVAIPIVFAIALHNIPEGVAVAVPVKEATNNKWKAFIYSLLSGLAEPLGALVGFMILMPFWNDTIEAGILALTAGIMIYISLDELLPTSERYGHHHLSIIGVVAGMLIMALSLVLL